MLSKTEKKLMGVIKEKIEGVIYEIKKVTPEDYLDKEGIPISKWQTESEAFLQKRQTGDLSLADLKKTWKRLFIKAVVSIDNQYDNLEPLINKIVENYFLSGKLYEIIGNHCLGLKKKNILKVFQKILS